MRRGFWVFIHRWTGLAMAGFLIIVGVTGALLAFNSELERLISPQLYAAPRPGVEPLDLASLAERAEVLVKGGQAIRGDHQERVAQFVDVPYLAPRK